MRLWAERGPLQVNILRPLIGELLLQLEVEAVERIPKEAAQLGRVALLAELAHRLARGGRLRAPVEIDSDVAGIGQHRLLAVEQPRGGALELAVRIARDDRM